jgi:hypothetical protein
LKYIVVLLILCASSAFGIVYSWIDQQGIRHYVNRASDIPERYRAKAKALYPEPTDTSSVAQNVQEQQKAGGGATVAPPENAPPPVVANDSAGTGRHAARKRGRRNSESSE